MKKIFLLFVAISLGIISCKKNDFPIPKQPSEASPNVLMIAALSSTASNNVTNYLGLTRWMGYWARDPMFPPDVQTETYAITNSYTDREWANIYSNLKLYDLLEKSGKVNGSPFYIGVAKLMKAYHFSTLVDLYNNVPYKQAFDHEQPAYDDAQSIYDDLVLQLDSTFDYFENARTYYETKPLNVAVNEANADIVFGNNTANFNQRLTLWQKLTNTLELKLLIHQSNIAGRSGYINNKITTLVSGKRKTAGFMQAGENATIQPANSNSSGTGYPLYDYFSSNFIKDTSGVSWPLWAYYTANAYADNFVNLDDDSDGNGNDYRAGYYINEAEVFVGIGGTLNYGDSVTISGDPLINEVVIHAGKHMIIYKAYATSNGMLVECDTLNESLRQGGANYDGDPHPKYHGIFADFLRIDTSFEISCFKKNIFIFSDFESLFLQAEAAQRGYINGNAQTLYESAIAQSFVSLFDNLGLFGNNNYGAADAQTYFSENIPDIGWNASPNKLEAIMTQKWAAMNGVNWVEAYNDYRRTGYPTSNILGLSHAPTHVRPQIPTRLLYPQSQLNANAANVPSLPDAQYSKVFWNQ